MRKLFWIVLLILVASAVYFEAKAEEIQAPKTTIKWESEAGSDCYKISVPLTSKESSQGVLPCCNIKCFPPDEGLVCCNDMELECCYCGRCCTPRRPKRYL